MCVCPQLAQYKPENDKLGQLLSIFNNFCSSRRSSCPHRKWTPYCTVLSNLQFLGDERSSCRRHLCHEPRILDDGISSSSVRSVDRNNWTFFFLFDPRKTNTRGSVVVRETVCFTLLFIINYRQPLDRCTPPSGKSIQCGFVFVFLPTKAGSLRDMWHLGKRCYYGRLLTSNLDVRPRLCCKRSNNQL
jgi:hypothetical protein